MRQERASIDLHCRPIRCILRSGLLAGSTHEHTWVAYLGSLPHLTVLGDLRLGCRYMRAPGYLLEIAHGAIPGVDFGGMVDGRLPVLALSEDLLRAIAPWAEEPASTIGKRAFAQKNGDRLRRKQRRIRRGGPRRTKQGKRKAVVRRSLASGGYNPYGITTRGKGIRRKSGLWLRSWARRLLSLGHPPFMEVGSPS